MSGLQRAKFVDSQKAKSSVLKDEHGYEYRKRVSQGNKAYWDCRRRDADLCPAKAVTLFYENETFIKSITVTFHYCCCIYIQIINSSCL